VDPAVQFSSGGRTVSFVVPANATEAVFPTQGTRIGLQTGTVASTITLAPTFATQAGNVELPPPQPAVLQLEVIPAAPVLVVARISGQTANSFVIGVTGFATTRNATTCNLDFAPVPGVRAETSRLTVDVQQIASAWFRSSASQAFGGQFSITIPIVLQGTVPSGGTLVSGLSSVSLSVDNELGTSNSLEVRVQ
jgi:hypothetical protein